MVDTAWRIEYLSRVEAAERCRISISSFDNAPLRAGAVLDYMLVAANGTTMEMARRKGPGRNYWLETGQAQRCPNAIGQQNRETSGKPGPRMVAPTGIDPVTFRFSVERSTN